MGFLTFFRGMLAGAFTSAFPGVSDGFVSAACAGSAGFAEGAAGAGAGACAALSEGFRGALVSAGTGAAGGSFGRGFCTWACVSA